MAEPRSPRPQVVTRSRIRAAGISDRQIDRRLSSGELVARRRGIISNRETGSRRVPVRVEAALLAHPSRDLVVSHATAAGIHGFPKPMTGWGDPTFTSALGSNRKRDGVVIRVAPLSPDDVVIIDGIAVTTPTRTVIDCFRTLQPRDALAIADAAAAKTSHDSLLAELATQAGWPGIVGARKLVALVDGRRETPLESWTAWAFARNGVPMPEWQFDISDARGRFIGRVDSWWSAGVAGEADGRSKYAMATAQRGGGESAALSVLHDERKREAGLRGAGLEVVRWVAADVLSDKRAVDLSRRVRSAIADALQAPRFTGLATPYVRRTP